jgi:hypothetical protein
VETTSIGGNMAKKVKAEKKVEKVEKIEKIEKVEKATVSARVLCSFVDAKTARIYKLGDVIEISKERADEIKKVEKDINHPLIEVL